MDKSELIVKESTIPSVAAKHALVPNVGLGVRDTVPAICPGAGGALKVMVASTVESKGEPSSAVRLSSEPEAEPEEIVGSNVATKLPGLLSVVTLQAEPSPVTKYVPVIVGMCWDGLPGTGVRGSYTPV